jgi:hypothetical protein
MCFWLREGTSRMNWAPSLDQMWRSPAFPMWLTLAAAAFFGLVVLITLLRAEKSVANGALTVITLLAIGVAVAATIRDYGPTGRASAEIRSMPSATASLPALACIDELAGDAVASACEKVVFASPESTAAAVSYTASLITRLTALGDVASAKASMTPELLAIRRALERDRYGMVAQVLTVREGCTGIQCPAFRSFADSRQISINMTERNYDAMVSHYAPIWNALPAVSAALGPPSLPSGRPTNAEFPSAASTPAVSIMNPEPTSGTPPNGQRPTQSAVNAQKQPPPTPAAPTAAMASAKKPTARRPAPAAPAQLAPGAAPAPAQAPADNE